MYAALYAFSQLSPYVLHMHWLCTGHTRDLGPRIWLIFIHNFKRSNQSYNFVFFNLVLYIGSGFECYEGNNGSNSFSGLSSDKLAFMSLTSSPIIGSSSILCKPIRASWAELIIDHEVLIGQWRKLPSINQSNWLSISLLLFFGPCSDWKWITQVNGYIHLWHFCTSLKE